MFQRVLPLTFLLTAGSPRQVMKLIWFPTICLILGLSIASPAETAEPGFVSLFDYDGSGVLDDELHKKQKVGMKGVIGLQLHSYHQLKLRFKDIRIKPL